MIAKKRLLPILVAVLMVFTMMPMLPAQNVYADSNETHPLTTIGVEGLFNPSQAGDGHSYVYYGKYNNTPILYRVLDKRSSDFGGFTMLLDCDKCLFDCRFDKNIMGSSDWSVSELRSTLNGDSFLNDPSVFTAIERNAIHASNKEQPTQRDGSPSYVYDPFEWPKVVDSNWEFAPLRNDKIFVLDISEATNTSYGYPSDHQQDSQKSRGKQKLSSEMMWTAGWWLRSQCYGPNYVGIVDSAGCIYYSKREPTSQDGYSVAASPAFNVDRSKIVLSTRHSGEYQKQGSVSKLSLLDPDFKVSVGRVSRTGNQATVQFGVIDDNNNNVTPTRCCIVMTTAEWHEGSGWGDGTTKYVCELELNGQGSTVGGYDNEDSFVLPQNYDESWNTYIIAEQEINGASTNVASAPVKIMGPNDRAFVISSSDDWDILANLVNNKNYDTSDMVVKLKNNIDVNTMIGTPGNPFKGIIDGNGKLLRFDRTTSEEYCAPFRYAQNATFCNLQVDGAIDTSAKFAAGLVAKGTGTIHITNCRCTTVIESHMGSAFKIADGTHGGYVAVGDTVIAEGCVFNGAMGGQYTKLCAGFFGWVNDTNGSDCINCIFYLWNMLTSDTANFIRNSTKATNSYYDYPIGQGRDRGKQLRQISGDFRQNVSVDFAGNGTTYNVSHITAYSTGLKIGDPGNCSLYAGAGDTVNLTMPDPSQEGKIYTVNAGTLTGSGTSYQLVMPDQDVKISKKTDLENKEINLSESSFTYNGEIQRPSINTIAGVTLTEGKDYTVDWSNASSRDIGTYTVTITGTGNYIGQSTAQYEITPRLVRIPKGKALVYNGKAQSGVDESAYYTVANNSATGAGTYTSTLTLKDKANCKWNDGTDTDKTVQWTISKAANPMTLKARTATVKYSRLKKKAQTLAVTKVIKFTKKLNDKKTYTLSSAKKGSKSFKKYFKISKTTGKVTIKKNSKMKKGTYKVKVKVKAAGNANYKASAVKTVTFKIKVK